MEERPNAPLIDAINTDKPLNEIRSLVENKADVNGRDKHNQTALMVAACNGQLDVVKLLLTENANSDEETLDGCSVFCFASDPTIQTVLEENGVENPHPTAAAMEKNPKKPLINTINEERSLNKIRLLIDNNRAHVNERDEHNQTALMVAACYERLDIVKFLLEKNANPHEKTLTNCSVFCFSANPKIRAVLAENGVKDPHLAAAANEKTSNTDLVKAGLIFIGIPTCLAFFFLHYTTS